MPGRPPKPPREEPLNRKKLVEDLLGNLATHKASTEKEAIERRTGRKMTDADRASIDRKKASKAED